MKIFKLTDILAVSFFIILSVLFLTYFMLIIFGFVYIPKLRTTHIILRKNAQSRNVNCAKTPTVCTTSLDCKSCLDSDKFELECSTMERPEHLNGKYGNTEKYCLPKKGTKECHPDYGGIWVWTGFQETGEGEWTCLCTYPHIASNSEDGCMSLNANVCNGGAFLYNGKTAKRPPLPTDCTCPVNTELISTNYGNIPLCVPNNPDNPYLCSNKEMCEQMYSESTFIPKK